jgi:hypothetical protein
MREPYQILLDTLLLCALFLLALVAFACSTIAEYAETQVPALFEPAEVIALDDGHMELRYSYCVDGICVERTSAITAVTIENAEGKPLDCMVVTQEVRWPDKSENVWIWPAKGSDPGCTAAMETLASPD